MKRSFGQLGEGGMPMGMSQCDAPPPKRSCWMVDGHPNMTFPPDDTLMLQIQDDSAFGEHYHAYKQWWLQMQATQTNCGAMAE